jgi:hypothetical protein
MAGYKHILEVEDFKQECDRFGFKLGHPSHGGYNREFGDLVALSPKDSDALPMYSRDAEMFIGTVENAKLWLRGIEWARNYDQMLFGNTHNKNRERKEQDRRNKNLVEMLKK